MPNVEPVLFRKKVVAGEKGVLTKIVSEDGTIEELRVRFYYGDQLKVKIRPKLRRVGNIVEDLLQFNTEVEEADKYLIGDDDYFEFRLVKSVSDHDILVIEYENTDIEEHWITVDIIIDHDLGKSRIVGSVV